MFALHLGHKTPDDMAFNRAMSEEVSFLREFLGTLFWRLHPTRAQTRHGEKISMANGKPMNKGNGVATPIMTEVSTTSKIKTQRNPLASAA